MRPKLSAGKSELLKPAKWGRILPVHMVKEAYKFAIPPLVIGAACLAFGWKWPAAVLIVLGLFVFYFFRDPERTIPSEPGSVVSPADGRVVEIVDEEFESKMGH